MTLNKTHPKVKFPLLQARFIATSNTDIKEPPFKSQRDDTHSIMMSTHDYKTAPDEEPRFLEQVQMFVAKAASKVTIRPDMLEYLSSCDHALRF
jgi:hypothetical protein